MFDAQWDFQRSNREFKTSFRINHCQTTVSWWEDLCRKKNHTCAILYPCYINECCFDSWWRNQTTQSHRDNKKDDGSEKKVALISISLTQLSVFVRGVTMYTEERMRDGNKVLWGDQSPFAHQMKDEKRTQETVTKEDSRVIERQGKRHSGALEFVWACVAD